MSAEHLPLLDPKKINYKILEAMASRLAFVFVSVRMLVQATWLANKKNYFLLGVRRFYLLLGVRRSGYLNRIEVVKVECEGTYLCWILRRIIKGYFGRRVS